MTRILLDINVILDVLLDRRPHVDASSAVWTAVETGRVRGFLSAHAMTTIYYLNRQEVGARRAREAIEALLSVFEVAAVDEGVLRSALEFGFPDFEDAVTASAAQRARCSAVVTRNPSDFRRSPMKVMAPGEAAAWLNVTA